MSDSIQSLVRADIEAREQLGIERYGTALFPHNGRSALQDAYEEALDLSMYLKQALVEVGSEPGPVERRLEAALLVLEMVRKKLEATRWEPTGGSMSAWCETPHGRSCNLVGEALQALNGFLGEEDE